MKKKGWMVGRVRMEAAVVTIDGGKEWYCRFCLETNVWTRSKCQSQTNIPSVLQGKHKQSVSNKGGRSWSELSSAGECEEEVLAHKTQ